MRATISQLCEHLEIPFLETKQVYEARRGASKTAKKRE